MGSFKKIFETLPPNLEELFELIGLEDLTELNSIYKLLPEGLYKTLKGWLLNISTNYYIFQDISLKVMCSHFYRDATH